MTDTPQDKGRAWEPEVAALLGMEKVPGSGNQLYKLDVGGRILLVSCKWTGKASYRIDRETVEELREATSGVAGIGAETVPVLAIKIEETGQVRADLDLMDFVALLKEKPILPASKDDVRRAAASTPSALR